MNGIIVTVTNKEKTFLCDMELPTNVVVSKMKDDMLKTLKEYNPMLFSRTIAIKLFDNRIGRYLSSDETLEEAGVWTGDFITIMEEQ